MTLFVRWRGVAAAIAWLASPWGSRKQKPSPASMSARMRLNSSPVLPVPVCPTDVDMPPAIGGEDRHALAGRERAENVIVVAVGHGVRAQRLAAVPCRVFVRLVRASVGVGRPAVHATIGERCLRLL